MLRSRRGSTLILGLSTLTLGLPEGERRSGQQQCSNAASLSGAKQSLDPADVSCSAVHFVSTVTRYPRAPAEATTLRIACTAIAIPIPRCLFSDIGRYP